MPHDSFIPAYLLRTGLLLLLLTSLAVLLNNGLFHADYPTFWMVLGGDAILILLAVSLQFGVSSGRLRGGLLWALLALVICALGFGFYQYDNENAVLGQTSNGWVSSGALLVMTVLVLIWLLRSLPPRTYRYLLRQVLAVISLSVIVILVLWPTNLAWLSFGLHREMHSLAGILFGLLLVNELLLERLKELPKPDFSRANHGYGLLILVSAVALWFHLHQLESRAVQQKAVQLVEQVFHSSEQELIYTEKLLQRMADRLALLGLEDNESYWQLDAAGYFRDIEALKHLAVVTEQDEAVISQGRDQTADYWFHDTILQQADVQSAFRQRQVTKLVLPSFEDRCWLLLLLPFEANQQAFTLIGSMELAKLVEKWQLAEPGFQLALTIQRNGDEALLTKLLPLSDSPQRLYLAEKDLLPGSVWRAEVYRVPDLWLDKVVFPPAVVLAFGYIFFFVYMLSQSLLAATARNEQQLVQSNRQLKRSLSVQSDLMALNESIMSNSVDVLTIINSDGYFIQLSEACEQVFGYQRDELMSKPFLELVHPDDMDRTKLEAEKIKQGRETQNFRNRYIQKNGTTIWLMWSARWSDESQTMFAIARDITEMVAQEQINSIRTSILQQIATNQSLQSILERICRFYMQQFIGSQCSVMLVKDGSLSTVAAPELSSSFIQAMDEHAIGPDSGVSGRAVFYKEKVIVANIEQDKSMAAFHALAKEHQIIACWSFPLLGNKASVLGAFIIHYKKEKVPTAAELSLIDACRQLSIVAIERERDRQQVQHSEQRYRSLFISNPDPVFSLDLDGKFTSVNRAGCLLLQMPEEQLLGKFFRDLLVEYEQERVRHFFDLTLHGSPQSYELNLRRKNGQSLTLQLSHTPIHIDHKIVGVFAIAKDLTEKLHNQENLRLFKRAVESSSNGVVITDARQPDLPIVFVNKAFERITGYSASEVLGRNCRFLQGGLRDEAAVQEIRLGIQEQAECHVLLENIRKDGTHFWNELFIAPVPDDEGTISHFVGVQNDVTAQKSYEIELAYNASHDILTGLPNRALLHDRLHQCCKMSDRSQRKLAVMFIDLDGFKLVNDTLGHLVGDQLLIDVSKRLTQQIRPGDTLARLGGDEFVVLLPELHQDGDVVLVAERILLHLNDNFVVEGHELHISASIGITLSACQLDDPTVLIQQADVAMYEAKQLGRNNYQWYKHALDKALGKQLTLRNELQKALTNQEFELHYQPQYDAGSLAIVGIEALIRWKHPTLGMVSPSDFIPIAEGSGQIIPMSEWVLDTACQFAAQMQQQGFHDLVMAVNISSLQFQRSNFVVGVKAVLQKHKLAPESLELEVTESVLLSYADSAIEKLHQLKKLGVHISIDDFGTGFSSLSYLKHLPIQKIKIDRSFIRDVIHDRHDAAITKAIISMAHHLQLTVVAEGVETKAQVAFLRRYQCDEFQGFYFAKPMPAADLETLLRSKTALDQPDQDLSEGEPAGRNLLLLDDEENILSALSRVLRRENYTIHLATSAEQAFELLAIQDIQVIVSDQRMPGMSGTEFLSKVKAMYPNTVRLVLSGYTDLKSVTEAINEGAIYKFITKPWDDKKLREEIRTAFLHHESQKPANKNKTPSE